MHLILNDRGKHNPRLEDRSIRRETNASLICQHVASDDGVGNGPSAEVDYKCSTYPGEDDLEAQLANMTVIATEIHIRAAPAVVRAKVVSTYLSTSSREISALSISVSLANTSSSLTFRPSLNIPATGSSDQSRQVRPRALPISRLGISSIVFSVMEA